MSSGSDAENSSQAASKRPKLAAILDGVSNTLKANFKEISAEFEHKGLKGRDRERALVEHFLMAYLPQRFGFANGEIVSTDGDVSGECDVIIYDAINCPILRKGILAIVPVEAANAVIEVKSRLDTGELLKSADNIARIKRMPKRAFYRAPNRIIKQTVSIYGKTLEYFPLVGFVFAYTSIHLATLAKELDEFNQNILPEHRIDYVCVLDSGGLIHTKGPNGGFRFFAENDTRIGFITSKNPLTPFLTVLQNLLLQSWPDPVRLGDYLEGEVLGNASYLKEMFPGS
jgi:hypothetical protein